MIVLKKEPKLAEPEGLSLSNAGFAGLWSEKRDLLSATGFNPMRLPDAHQLPGPGVAYRLAPSIANIPGITLASYAWHAVHPALIGPHEGRMTEAFLVHRDNASYRYYAIPPVDDWAMMSIPDGLRLLFSDVDSTISAKVHLPYRLYTKEARESDGFIVAARPFVDWDVRSGDRVEKCSMIPVREVLPEGARAEEELSWLVRIGTKGSTTQERVDFQTGWELILQHAWPALSCSAAGG